MRGLWHSFGSWKAPCSQKRLDFARTQLYWVIQSSKSTIKTGEIIEYTRLTGTASTQHDVDYGSCAFRKQKYGENEKTCKNVADRNIVKAVDSIPWRKEQSGNPLARNAVNLNKNLVWVTKNKTVCFLPTLGSNFCKHVLLPFLFVSFHLLFCAHPVLQRKVSEDGAKTRRTLLVHFHFPVSTRPMSRICWTSCTSYIPCWI